MKIKIISSIVVVILGLGLLGFSYYVKDQVMKGEAQIAAAKEKVAKGKAMLSFNPITKEIGKGIEASASHKIREGQELADKYSILAKRLQLGGIIVIILGASIMLIPIKRR
jgi:hypothetical protein